MTNLYLILIFLVAYFLGSFPTAYLITKRFTGKDVREAGTKNVGALNVQRVTGKFYLFLSTLTVDVGKGALAVLIPQWLSFLNYNLLWAITLGAFGVVLGHCFSCFLKFQGGKAIASLIGIFAVLNFYWLLLPWGGICLIFIFVSGYLFLGQFMGTIFLPIIGYFLIPEYFWLCLLVAIPVFIKQWPRFIPMLKGQEPKLYWSEKKKNV